MRRITNSIGIRIGLLTVFMSAVATILPLVALAGQGNPSGY